MSMLALDVGNTNTVVGLIDKSGQIKKTWRVSTHPLPTADEFRAKLQWLFQTEGLPSIDQFEAVVVSSVVPSFAEMLRSAFSRNAEHQFIHFINSQSPFSFSIKASPAHQVGADRLVNAQAALKEYGAPCIIIDSGTATTLCAINHERAYLGGAIMPGLELSLETLARRAAQLFTVELTAPTFAIGTNTADALRSGLMHGYAAMIDGMVEKFKNELDPHNKQKIRVIGTGGISARLQPLTKSIDVFDPDLTLKGIALIYDSLRR